MMYVLLPEDSKSQSHDSRLDLRKSKQKQRYIRDELKDARHTSGAVFPPAYRTDCLELFLGEMESYYFVGKLALVSISVEFNTHFNCLRKMAFKGSVDKTCIWFVAQWLWHPADSFPLPLEISPGQFLKEFTLFSQFTKWFGFVYE